MIKVRFSYADVSPIKLRNKARVKGFIEELFLKEERALDFIQYVFCSDSYLLEINKSFLQHDYFTDIITFDLSEKGRGTTGEVYISVDRVVENAEQNNVSFRNEVLRVIFHGALHLCGYKDKKKSEITIMREKEEYYLHLFEQN